jgi:hypothetical protein
LIKFKKVLTSYYDFDILQSVGGDEWMMMRCNGMLPVADPQVICSALDRSEIKHVGG